jgi:hypothetical protein
MHQSNEADVTCMLSQVRANWAGFQGWRATRSSQVALHQVKHDSVEDLSVMTYLIH